MTYDRPYLFLRKRENSGRPWPPARSTCSTRSTRRGPVVAPAALGLGPVDPVQQHRQFPGAQGHAGLARSRGRPGEDSFFQSLVDDDVAVLVPVEQFDAVAPLVAKNEDVPGQRVVVQVLPHLGGQPVERGIFLIPSVVRTARMIRPRPSRSSIPIIFYTVAP